MAGRAARRTRRPHPRRDSALRSRRRRRFQRRRRSDSPAAGEPGGDRDREQPPVRCACARRIAGRTSSWRCCRTSCATRWRRSGTPCTSCGCRARGDAVLEQTSEMMMRQVDHMVRLVDDLLDVSRITRGKIVLQREVVDASTIVNRAIEASRPAIEASRHALTVTFANAAAAGGRRPDPHGAGGHEPLEQRREVHAGTWDASRSAPCGRTAMPPSK